MIASIDGNTDVFLEDIALMCACIAHCVIRYVYDVFGRFWRATEQEVQPGRIGFYLYGECHGRLDGPVFDILQGDSHIVCFVKDVGGLSCESRSA